MMGRFAPNLESIQQQNKLIRLTFGLNSGYKLGFHYF
jgi:hypothetical protein